MVPLKTLVSIPLLIIFTTFLIQCSTIQKLDERSYTRKTPILKPLSLNVDSVVEKKTDHKYRKKNKLTPDILVVFPTPEWKAKLSPREEFFFKKEILRSMDSPDFRIHTLPSEPSLSQDDKTDRIKAYSLSKKIDGILDIIPISVGENFSFRASLRDPVIQKEYSQTDLSWKMENPDPSGLVYWKEGNDFNTIQESTPKPEKVLLPDPGIWKEIFSQSLMGSINIYASSSDTTIKINDKEMGAVPIRSLSLLNGIHRIEFSRPGVDPVIRSMQIRAGLEKSLIHEWEGDRTTSSLQIQSYPQGLEVWLDSFKKGEANYYQSETLPGDLRIRLTKTYPTTMGGSEEYLFAEGVGTLPDKSWEAFALPYNLTDALGPENAEFWKPVGEKGFLPVFSPQLGFGKENSPLPPGDYGFQSALIFRGDIVWEGRFEPFSVNGERFGFLLGGEDRFFLLEAFGEELALFEWKGSGRKTIRSLGVWKFKKDTKPEDRIFRIIISTDPEKPSLVFRLGNREIHKSLPPSGDFWRAGILTRGEKFRNGNGIKELKVEYPHLVDWVKSKEKEK